MIKTLNIRIKNNNPQFYNPITDKWYSNIMLTKPVVENTNAHIQENDNIIVDLDNTIQNTPIQDETQLLNTNDYNTQYSSQFVNTFE